MLQDRLVKALRLAGIQTIAAANAWLPSFVQRHNARFASAPFEAQDAHVPHAPAADIQLRQTLAKHYPRKLSNTLSCQFHSTLLQIQSATGGAGLRGASVTVLEHFDHPCQVLWRNVILPHTTVQKVRAAPLEQGRKEVTIARRAPASVAQSPKHPWNNSRLGKLSPEFSAKR